MNPKTLHGRPGERHRSPMAVMFLFATVMGGFMLFLVLLNYASARRVHRAMVLQTARETEKRALALEFIFSELRDNLVDLSNSRELSVYFENQALGMSMEYGLRQSLPPILDRLEYYRQSKRIKGDPVYARLALVLNDGTVLVDTGAPRGGGPADSSQAPALAPAPASALGPAPVSALAPGPGQEGVVILGGGREVMLSRAHRFKEAEVGRLLAWIDLETLGRHLLDNRDSTGVRGSYWLLEKGKLRQTIGRFSASAVPLPPTGRLAAERVFEFTTDGSRDEYLAVRAPVPDVPFEILYVAPTRETLGQLKPGQYLLGMGLLTIVLIAGAAYSIRIYLRSRILSVRLGEVEARERVVSEKNEELQREVVERTRAQESLNILRMGMEEIPLDDLLARALDGLMEISWLGCREECAVHLLDDRDLHVSRVTRRGIDVECGPLPSSASGPEWRRWAETGRIRPRFVRHDEAGHPPHCGISGEHAHQWMPLTAGGQLTGVLSLTLHPGHVLGEPGRSFLEAFAGVLSFIIQRRRADEELRIAHEANQALVSAIPLVLITLDGDGRILRYNAAAERVLRMPADRAIGQRLAECRLPWHFPSLSGALDASASTARPFEVKDVRFARPDGREGFLSVTISPIADSGPDAAARTLVVASDITERREFEAQALLTQKLEAIGQLAAGIAHEINTPAQYIRDNLSFLQDVVAAFLAYARQVQEIGANGLPEESSRKLALAAEDLDLDFVRENGPKALGEAAQGIARITEIVSAMKEFSGPVTGERESIDLNRALASSITVSQSEWRQACDIDTDFDPELPSVAGYAVEMNQVFLNLIVNAAHAIEDTVGRAGGRGRISISTRRDGGTAEVRIRDTGGGIPEKIRDRIYDPFFTTKAVGRGTGQGLSTARSIVVDRHGGELSFETAMGEGTTFLIRLPAA